MPEQCLFDIPIYWRDEARFYREYEVSLTKHLADFERNSGYPITEDLRLSLTDGFWKNYVAPWRFNQIVGWLCIYRLGSQLRGELWYMNARRAGRQVVKKQFSDKGKAFEMHVSSVETSSDIHQHLAVEVSRYAKTLQKGQLLDTACLDNLAHLINWRQLIDS